MFKYLFLQHLYSPSVWTLPFSTCLFMPPFRKAQSALIGHLSQTWAGTNPPCFCISSARVVATMAVLYGSRMMSLIKSIDFQFESMISFLFSDTAPSRLNFFCFLSKCLLEVKKITCLCSHFSFLHTKMSLAFKCALCTLRSNCLHAQV